MKKTLLLFSLLLISFTQINIQGNNSKGEVYICMGKYAKTYHKTIYCIGLNRCRSEVRKISLNQAQARHRRPCKICY